MRDPEVHRPGQLRPKSSPYRNPRQRASPSVESPQTTEFRDVGSLVPADHVSLTDHPAPCTPCTPLCRPPARTPPTAHVALPDPRCAAVHGHKWPMGSPAWLRTPRGPWSTSSLEPGVTQHVRTQRAFPLPRSTCPFCLATPMDGDHHDCTGAAQITWNNLEGQGAASLHGPGDTRWPQGPAERPSWIAYCHPCRRHLTFPIDTERFHTRPCGNRQGALCQRWVERPPTSPPG